jgi:hypothetical protein
MQATHCIDDNSRGFQTVFAFSTEEGCKFLRVCEGLFARNDAPNHALQRTPYPVPALMVTENFSIKLQVKRAAVRRR